jgi:RNA polymerase sigma-70 factor (ECF subfamily)
MVRIRTGPLVELDMTAQGAVDDIEQVFRQYAPYVSRIGMRILGRAEDVDDLIQDVFLEAHRGLKALRAPAAIRSWLATVAVRLARRKLHRRRLRTVLRLEDAPIYEVADASATPEERALLNSVYRLLDALPVNQRLAWTLRYVEGETLERVAELSGCSLAAAKRRIRAARETLDRWMRNG